MSNTEQVLKQLSDRVSALEDQLEIMKLVASYGPAVDSLSGQVVESMWADDGVYDWDGIPVFEGKGEVANLVNDQNHQTWVRNGCAHILSAPRIVVSGDTAVVTGYSSVFLHQGDGWRVHRTSSNRWELLRTPDGWKVKSRLNRLLNGASSARDLLARGFEES